MRTAAFAIALLLSGGAIAQTTTVTEPDVDVDADIGVQPDGDLDIDADVDLGTKTTTIHDASTHGKTAQGTNTTIASTMTPASGTVVQPGNTNPEEDARGIAVISDPAIVPAGWNGLTGTAMGGPLIDTKTGETVNAADISYAACSATVTDNCVQTYERGRSPR
jgi:hypothetical protein